MNKKPTAYYKYILAIDCETTGLCFNSDSPVFNPETGERHQAVSWGIIVTNAQTLEPIEELYVEIAWNEHSVSARQESPQFGKKAEDIHGLTCEYLDAHGMAEEDAVAEVVSLIAKYWGSTTSIVTLGHNNHLFDVPFLRDMCRRYGIELKLGNRHIDTNSIGFVNWETYDSNQLFSLMGHGERGDHNALDDIRMSLQAAQVSRMVFKQALEQ